MTVDGISYELELKAEGHTTKAYLVLVDGKVADPDLIVVRHEGASADMKWCLLKKGLPRLEANNRVELFEQVSKVLHG